MVVGSVKMKAWQYVMLGEDPPGVWLELAHGGIVVWASPSYEHSYAETQLLAILGTYIDEQDLGELVSDVDTILDEWNVRRPDLLFLTHEKAAKLPEKGHGIPFAPDLCVEILSPASATVDLTDKFELYARSGVPFYWLVDPRSRTFCAYKLVEGRYVEIAEGVREAEVRAGPFDGLKVPLGRLWVPKRNAGTPRGC